LESEYIDVACVIDICAGRLEKTLCIQNLYELEGLKLKTKGVPIIAVNQPCCNSTVAHFFHMYVFSSFRITENDSQSFVRTLKS